MKVKREDFVLGQRESSVEKAIASLNDELLEDAAYWNNNYDSHFTN